MTERISQRQVVEVAPARKVLAASAKAVDTTLPGANGGELGALIDGLAGYSAQVARHQVQTDQFDAKEAALTGASMANQVEDPVLGVKLPPPEVPAGVNPAFKDHFEVTFRDGMGARVAAKAQDSLLSDYAMAARKPDFVPEAFLSERRAAELQGTEDPIVRAHIAKAHDDAAGLIRGDVRKRNLDAFVAQQKENVASLVSTQIHSANSAEQNAAALFGTIMPAAKAEGVVMKPEVQQYVSERLVALSNEAGGRPDLFDMFGQKDPATGKTLLEHMPTDLQAKVSMARKHAQDQYDARYEKGRQGDYADMQMKYIEDAKRGVLPTWADFKAATLGPGKPFQRDNEVLSSYLGLQRMAEGLVDLTASVAQYQAGMGTWLDKPTLKLVLAKLEAPIMANLMGAQEAFLRTNDPKALAAFTEQAKALHALYGKSSDISDSVKKFIGGARGEGLSKDGSPTPNFKLAAAVYAEMPPAQREMYADADSKKLFDIFELGLKTGVGEKAAYTNAFFSITPEAKAQEEKLRAKDSPFHKAVNSALGESQRDGSLAGWIGSLFGNVPDNLRGVVEEDTKAHLLKMAQVYPNQALLPDWQKEQTMRFMSANYVKDPVSNMLVKKESGMNASQFAGVVALKQADFALAHPEVAAAGGSFEITHRQGSFYSVRVLDRAGVDVGMLVSSFDASAELQRARLTNPDGTPTASASTLATLRTLGRDNKLTVDYLDANKDQLSSLRTLGVLQDADTKMIEAVRARALREQTSMPFKVNMGPVNPSGIDTKATGFSRQDTVGAAGRFAAEGKPGLSLTAMREGFVATATADPNKEAGNNIGFGYNLKSRSLAQIREDFRASGIPPEHAEAIVAGTKGITVEQGMSLLRVVRPQYEKQVEQVAGRHMNPTQWARTPQNVKDVLADVAYQVRDVGVFTKAFKAIAENDTAGLDKLLTVHFKKDKESAMQPDAGGNKLRAQLLLGNTEWNNALKLSAARPSTKLQAAEVATAGK